MKESLGRHNLVKGCVLFVVSVLAFTVFVQPANALTADNYELLVYAKAALFFNALRQRLGDKMYMEVMRTYVETYRWKIVTPQHFFGLAQMVSGVNLNPLAEEWLH